LIFISVITCNFHEFLIKALRFIQIKTNMLSSVSKIFFLTAKMERSMLLINKPE